MPNSIPSTTGIASGGSTGKDTTGWAGTHNAQVDTTGLNIPGTTGFKTFATLFQAVQADAYHGKSGGALWAMVKPILRQPYNGYPKNQIKAIGWTPHDATALQELLEGLHSINTLNKTSPLTAQSFFTSHLQPLGPGGSGSSSTIASKVLRSAYSIPAQADLTSAAQQAFSSVLGRSASPQEAADFATKYQQLVQSYDSAKINVRAGKSFNAPQTPIQFAQSGQTPTSTAVPSDPTAATGLEAPPTPSVAASNFAAQNNPTQASAQAAADGLGQFLAMLKGS